MATQTTTQTTEDEYDDGCPDCGCWCGYCDCSDARVQAEEGMWEFNVPAHCCECGLSGTDAEYNCHCG